MTYISLFSGAGISDWGFHQAGWECVAQVEIDKQANAVRKRHFPDVPHFEDVRSFDAKQFRGVDAVIGGFPCQDYSVAGKRAGLVGDRGALWWEFHRIVRESGAPLVIGENVPGLLSADKGRSFGTILTSLVQLGFSVSWRVLDLRYFRVPQRRRRVFIVGSLGSGRSAEILFESDCLPGDSQTCEDEGEDTPSELARCLRASCGDSDPDIDTYIPIGFPSNGINDISECNLPMLRPCNPAAVAFTALAQANSYAWERDHYPCLNAQVPNDSSNIQHGVRQGLAVRRLTPRECERLMGLPDDFTRYDNEGKEMADGPRYKMLGNGWSVPQAEWLARRSL